MANKLSDRNNQIVPSGTILLSRPIQFDEHSYVKVWAPFWDTVIRDLNLTSDKDIENKDNWDWHVVWEDKVIWSVPGEKVVDFVEDEVPPFDDKKVYIHEPIRKYLERAASKWKKEKKAKAKE